jgi:hypothetical protein
MPKLLQWHPEWEDLERIEREKINWEILETWGEWRKKLLELILETDNLKEELMEKKKLIEKGEKKLEEIEKKTKSETFFIYAKRFQELSEAQEEIANCKEKIDKLIIIIKAKNLVINGLKTELENQEWKIEHERWKAEQNEESKNEMWKKSLKDIHKIANLKFEKRKLETKTNSKKEKNRFLRERIQHLEKETEKNRNAAFVTIIAVIIAIAGVSLIIKLFSWLKKSLKRKTKIKKSFKT